MKPLSKYIYWALIAGISCTVIKLYFSQQDMATSGGDAVDSWPWYFRLAFLGNVAVTFAAVSSFFLYKEYFPKYVVVCYVLLILFVIIASWDSFGQTLSKPNFFYTIKGLGTFINIGILFFAADTKYFPKILKYFYYTCLFILAASLMSLGKVGLGASRKEFLTYIRDYTVYLMWVFPYFLLQEEGDKKKNLFNLGAAMLLFILVFSSGSRSYLTLFAVYAISKFSRQLATRNGVFAIIGLVVFCVGGYFILMNSPLASTVELAFSNLAERSGEDTRSEQIYEFLAQYDTAYMFQGVGPLKLWFWNSLNDYYGHLDNQFMLIAWWAGIPTVTTYFIFLAKSLFVKSEIQLYENVKGTKLIIFFWITACAGFAIYCTLSSEAYYYFISLIMGLNACQYTKLIPEDEQIENASAAEEDEHEFA